MLSRAESTRMPTPRGPAGLPTKHRRAPHRGWLLLTDDAVERSFVMPGDRVRFAALLHYSIPELARRKAPGSEVRTKEAVMDLDMGEGSREQGFRQNGCR